MKKASIRTKGSITVYLALSLVIIVTLIISLLFFARTQTIRFHTELASDIGINSTLAEYHREILKQYDLFFIDSSYGSNEGSVEKVEAHFLNFMRKNCEGMEITALSADNATLDEISYGTDQNGLVLRYQIDRYMKDIYGISALENNTSIISTIQSLLGRYGEYSDRRNKYNKKVKDTVDKINSEREEDENKISISNPGESVETLNAYGAISYAIGNLGNLRLSNIDASNYISKRGIANKGVGLYEGQEAAEGAIEQGLFIDYLFKHLGYYGNELDKSNLTYQIEYLLKGNGSDYENLSEIAKDIFMTRYVINILYLLTDSGKQAEAEAMAMLTAAVILNPELVEGLKWAIIFAWAYAESAKDMRILYDGNKLGLMKDAATWNTPLYQMVGFKNYLNIYKAPSNGVLDYKGYLMVFLLIKDMNTRTMRFMDICEMDIRLTKGNESFRFDNLIYQFNAEANVSSRYGYGCSIKRIGTYE